MKNIIFIFFLFLASIGIQAQEFSENFVDKTLRIDYILSGNSSSQTVSLNQLNELPQWAGRRTNLSRLLWKGNGQIKMTNAETGKCIYTDSFSTLFQEWQTTIATARLYRVANINHRVIGVARSFFTQNLNPKTYYSLVGNNIRWNVM